MQIKNSEDLKAAILELEDRKQRQQQELVQNIKQFKESLTPANLLKSGFNKVKESPGMTGTILKASLGLGVGLLSKKLLLGKSPGFLRKIIGSAIQMGVTGLVAKKTDDIKSSGDSFFKKILRSIKKK